MILITGHRGFVGGHLTKFLDEKEVKWIGYDLVDGNDIRNRFKLNNIFFENEIDMVIHLAALASPLKSMMFPDEFISTNINGTQYLLECAKRHGVKQIIAFSSSSVYGEAKPPSREDDPMLPTSIYAITKLTSEYLIKASDVPYTIIRPFTLYGLNGRPDQVVYKWINLIKQGKPITIYGDGTSRRGYTFIDDLVQGVFSTIGNEKAMNQVFNLGGTEIFNVYQLGDIFKRVVECQVNNEPTIQFAPLLKGDIYENWADISKARELLGYSPQENFEKNLEAIIKAEI